MSVHAQTVQKQDAPPRRNGTLHIVPALIAPSTETGSIVLTQKFLDGIRAYQQRWSGPVNVHMLSEGHRDRHLDDVTVDPSDPHSPFRRIEAADMSWIETVLDDAAVFLVSLVDRNLPLVQELVDRGATVVLITEQSERTRDGIIRAETRNPVLRWRRQWWSHRIERQYIDAVLAVTGVQCNGAPTYEAYRRVNRNAMFYLDSRMTAEMIATPQHIEHRFAALRNGEPLRLGFSGRLVAIKGADDLPLVAMHLRDLGVAFTLDIIGGGTDEFEQLLRSRIAKLDLEKHVRMRGVMDFESELVPYLRENIDIFLCCHRQGDPSCTYIETLGCGVPVAGYDNEAWRGLHERGVPGWIAPMSDPLALATRLVELDAARNEVEQAAVASREFALEHTFEATMDQRVEHLRACAGSVKELLS